MRMLVDVVDRQVQEAMGQAVVPRLATHRVEDQVVGQAAGTVPAAVPVVVTIECGLAESAFAESAFVALPVLEATEVKDPAAEAMVPAAATVQVGATTDKSVRARMVKLQGASTDIVSQMSNLRSGLLPWSPAIKEELQQSLPMVFGR